MKKIRINVVTFGCAKNTVDSEHLMGQLGSDRFSISFDSDDERQDVVVVNTCGFIADAKEESIDAILAYAAAKNEGKIKHLFVIGCLSERYMDDLRAEIPEVDRYFGVHDLGGVVEALGAEYAPEAETRRVLTTPPHYAYLKVSEGCSRACGFCIIPGIRGKHVSVPEETLLEEARELAAGGVKELIVIAQDTTYYGVDLYGERRLGPLLRALCRIEGIEWVRLHYAYPAAFPADVIEAMRDEPKICPYLDIPLQHISDAQLSSMKRGITRAQTEELIARLRREVPGIAIRTTMLVGYPGETRAEFEELLDFVRRTCFERLGAFAYSAEEGTYSAEKLADDVSPEEKQARVEALMELQGAVSLEANLARVGRTERVVIDRREGEFLVGRSAWDSPEVDQEVLVRSPRKLAPGTFVEVRITDAEEFDLYAEIMNR